MVASRAGRTKANHMRVVVKLMEARVRGVTQLAEANAIHLSKVKSVQTSIGGNKTFRKQEKFLGR